MFEYSKGCLGDHVLPGLLFSLFGFWWSFLAAIRFSLQTSKFLSDSTKQIRFRPLVWESLMKLFFLVISISYTIYHLNFGQLSISNIMHINLAFFFVLGSIVELLISFNLVELPDKCDMVITNCLGTFFVSIMLTINIDSELFLEIFMHKLLGLTALGVSLISVAEMIEPRQILFVYGRCYGFLLHTTWWTQIGFVLNGKNNDNIINDHLHHDETNYVLERKKHEKIMSVASIFCWHILAIGVFLLLQLILVRGIYEKFNWFSKRVNKCFILSSISVSHHSQKYSLLKNLESQEIEQVAETFENNL
jgi:hypothetical protein